MGFLDLIPGKPHRQPAIPVITFGGNGKDAKAEVDRHLSSIEVVTSTTEAWTAKLVFDMRRSDKGDWSIADGFFFKSKDTIVHIALEFGASKTEKLFVGRVQAPKALVTQDTGASRFEVELQDLSCLLDDKHACRMSKEGDTIHSFVAELLTDSDLVLKRDPAGVQFPVGRPITVDTTPMRLIREKAVALGLRFYPDISGNDPNGRTFCLAPITVEKSQFAAAEANPIRYMAGWDTNGISFSADEGGMGAHQVSYPGTPDEKGQEQGGGSCMPTGIAPMGKTPLHGGVSDLRASNKQIPAMGDATLAERRFAAQNMANRNSFRISAKGDLDGSLFGRVLRVGQLAYVEGVGDRASGIYLVEKVTHTIGADGYKQSFEMLRNAVDSFKGIAMSKAQQSLERLLL